MIMGSVAAANWTRAMKAESRVEWLEGENQRLLTRLQDLEEECRLWSNSVTKLETKIDWLQAVLQRIAQQKTRSELDDEDVDFEGAYDFIIQYVREALAKAA